MSVQKSNFVWRSGSVPWVGFALMSLAALGACSSADEAVNEPQEPEVIVYEEPEDLEFPNLSDVPDGAPATSSRQERQQRIQELGQDATGAVYTDSPIYPRPGGGTDSQTPAREIELDPPPALNESRLLIEEVQLAWLAEGGTMTDVPLIQVQQAGPGGLAAIIYFNFGSDRLGSNDQRIIAEVARIHQSQGGTILVVGHSSATTGVLDQATHEAVNRLMSEKRANAVVEALRGQGVAADAILVEARSDDQPVFHEFMPTGEAGNRRVEIYLLQ